MDAGLIDAIPSKAGDGTVSRATGRLGARLDNRSDADVGGSVAIDLDVTNTPIEAVDHQGDTVAQLVTGTLVDDPPDLWRRALPRRVDDKGLRSAFAPLAA